MIRYFKTNREYFRFINKNKGKYDFDVYILPKSIKVKCNRIS